MRQQRAAQPSRRKQHGHGCTGATLWPACAAIQRQAGHVQRRPETSSPYQAAGGPPAAGTPRRHVTPQHLRGAAPALRPCAAGSARRAARQWRRRGECKMRSAAAHGARACLCADRKRSQSEVRKCAQLRSAAATLGRLRRSTADEEPLERPPAHSAGCPDGAKATQQAAASAAARRRRHGTAARMRCST